MPLILTADANPGTATWSTADVSHGIVAAGTSPDIAGGTTVVVPGTFTGLGGSPVQITPTGDWGSATNWWYTWAGDVLSIDVDVDPAAALTFSYAILAAL